MIHPGFSEAEYQRRVSDLQAGLESRGLGGAILTAEANYNYFAGYHHFAPWTTFCRPVFLLVPTVGAPVMLVHGFPLMDARRDTWFPDVRGYDDLMYAPIEQVLGVVDELGMRSGPIGMELGAEHRIGLTGNELDDLRASLSPVPVVDIGDLIWSIRIIKSAAEVDLHRESGRIAAAAFERCFSALHEGMTEVQAADVLGETIASEGARAGFFIVTSGQGFYDRTAGLPRERALERGDMLWIDLGVVYRGYWTDHCRAATIGPASQGQRDNWNAMRELTWSAVEQVRAHRRPPELVSHLEAEAAKMGLAFNFSAGRVGHGIGLMSTEPPHIASYYEDELLDGMTITIEPGWTDQELGTFIAEENLVVRADGPEMLTVTPRELIEVA